MLGEAFQLVTTRRAFRLLVDRGEPRGLPREFVDGMYDHYGRRASATSSPPPTSAASGHWPYADAPDTVRRLLVDFLRRVRAGRPG